MTAREVFVSLENISKRTKSEYIFQAKIHGAEINEPLEKVNFSKEKDDAMTRHMEKINKERFGGN